MAFSPATVTGSAITGLTSPTVTWTADGQTPSYKRFVATALGGTQTGVSVHTVSAPFACEFSRPASLKVLPQPISGRYVNIPKNRYTIRLRKGAQVVAGVYSTIDADINIAVPAGAETNDTQAWAAFCSALGGLVSNQIAGLFDTGKLGSV